MVAKDGGQHQSGAIQSSLVHDQVRGKGHSDLADHLDGIGDIGTYPTCNNGVVRVASKQQFIVLSMCCPSKNWFRSIERSSFSSKRMAKEMSAWRSACNNTVGNRIPSM